MDSSLKPINIHTHMQQKRRSFGGEKEINTKRFWREIERCREVEKAKHNTVFIFIVISKLAITFISSSFLQIKTNLPPPPPSVSHLSQQPNQLPYLLP